MPALINQGKMIRAVHQYIGQEAVAVGVSHALTKQDKVTSNHRCHGHYLAKGGNPNALMAELYGKADGCNNGKSGTMRITDLDIGILSTGVVGSMVPVALGIAMANKLSNNKRVAVAFFGDGASNTGAVYESLNLAASWSLPIIFACENNMYALTTPFKESSPVEIYERAKGFGLRATKVDGMNVLSVYDAAKEAVKNARECKPQFIEFKTYRYCGHYVAGEEKYRTKDELELWKQKDPILNLKNYLSDKIDKQKIENLERKANLVVKDAITFAENSPWPDLDNTTRGVFK